MKKITIAIIAIAVLALGAIFVAAQKSGGEGHGKRDGGMGPRIRAWTRPPRRGRNDASRTRSDRRPEEPGQADHGSEQSEGPAAEGIDEG